jgi:hypothetical protein
VVLNKEVYPVFLRSITLLLSFLFLPSLVFAATQKAVFVEAKGKVVVVKKGMESPAKIGTSVVEGDEIILRSGSSRAELKSDIGNVIRLRGNTHVKFEEMQKGVTSQQTRLALIAGKVWASVTKLATKGSRFEIKAGGVVCGVRGTEFEGDYDSKKDKGKFKNHKGKIRVTGKDGKSVDVPEGGVLDFAGGILDSMGDDHQNDSSKGRKQSAGDSGENSGFAGGAAMEGAGDSLLGVTSDAILSSGVGRGPSHLILGFEFPELVDGPFQEPR